MTIPISFNQSLNGGSFMEAFATYALHFDFFISMFENSGSSFDNENVIDLRFSVVLVEKGSGIASLDGKYIPYIAPCVFCVNEKEHLIIPESDGVSLRAVLFHPNVVNSVLNFNNLLEQSPDTAVTILQDKSLFNVLMIREHGYIGKFDIGPITEKKIEQLLDGMHEMIIKQPTNWPCRSRSYIMQLLFLLDNLYKLNASPEKTYFETLDDNFYAILLYIYHNYDKKITVSDITDRFFISKVSLAKMFQKNLGDTFLSYLNKLRISMAATMLRDTLLPINEIMYRVGFTDAVHFLRTFKKYLGMSPSTYRENYCWV